MLDYGDRINIKGLKVYAYHGCLEEERTKGQEFTLDITLHLNLTPAGITDTLEKTVNYSEACAGPRSIYQVCLQSYRDRCRGSGRRTVT